MSRTKDANWPEDYRPPRPRPLIHALLAAWHEFKRDLKAQRRLIAFRKDFTIF